MNIAAKLRTRRSENRTKVAARAERTADRARMRHELMALPNPQGARLR